MNLFPSRTALAIGEAGRRPIDPKVVHLFAPSRVNNFFGLGGGLLPVRFNGFTALAAAASAFLRGPMPFLVHLALVQRRGIFPGDGMVREIDRLLRDSPLLQPHKTALPPDGLLRFYDVTALHDPRTMPLFLIITDVRGADIIVVSSAHRPAPAPPRYSHKMPSASTRSRLLNIDPKPSPLNNSPDRSAC